MGVAGRGCGVGMVGAGASRAEVGHPGLAEVPVRDKMRALASESQAPLASPWLPAAQTPAAHLSRLLFVHPPLAPSVCTVPSAWNTPPAPPSALPAGPSGLRSNTASEPWPSRTIFSGEGTPRHTRHSLLFTSHLVYFLHLTFSV